MGICVYGASPQASRQLHSTPQAVRHLYTCSYDQRTSNYYWSDAFSTTETDSSKIFEAWDEFIQRKYGYKNELQPHCYGEGQPSLESVQRFERLQMDRIGYINPTWKFIETSWHYPGASASGPPSGWLKPD
jgi:hypothetical protein